MNENYALRVIGKPLLQFSLYSDIFSVGSDENDDIIIEGVGPKALEIGFVGHSVLLTRAKSAVWIDGKMAASFPVTVSPGQVISLSPTDHLFFGAPKDAEPAAPHITAPETQKKRALPVLPTPWVRVIATAFAVIALYIAAVYVVDSRFTRKEESIAVQSAPAINAVAFIEEVFGKSLLAISEEESKIVVKAIVTSAKSTQESDLANLRSTKPIELQWVDLKDLLFHVKQSLAAQKWTITQQHTTFTIRGLCVARECDQVPGIISAAAAKNPDAVLVDEIVRIYPDFEIVSVSVSNRAAQATLRRHGQIVVVPENGRVFDLGVLRLITQKGITVATRHGDIFIAWSRS